MTLKGCRKTFKNCKNAFLGKIEKAKKEPVSYKKHNV